MTNNAENLNTGSGSGSSQGAINVAALIERAKAIILQPKEVWATIKAEPGAIQDVLKNWLLPMAAVPAICALIGQVVFGYPTPTGTYRVPFGGALTQGIGTYLMMIIFPFVAAFIADKLAGMFSGSSSFLNAFKLVTYAAAPAYVAGILSLIPMLGIIGGLISLYSIYVLYQGIGTMLGVPNEKKLMFFISFVVCGFVASLILGIVFGGMMVASSMGGSFQSPSGSGEEFDAEKVRQGFEELQKFIPQNK